MLQLHKSKYEDIVRNIEQKKYFQTENGRQITHVQVLPASFMKYHLTGAFIYIRKKPTEAQTRKLEKYLNSLDLIMGDFNLKPKREGVYKY